MADRREMGALEAEVLAHLWGAKEAMTPADVLAAMGEDLAYTTVMTIMARLWKKGLVERERRGRAFAYRPVLSEADLTARRMRATLDRAGDRKAALATFIGTLSKRDERLLRRMLGTVDDR